MNLIDRVIAWLAPQWGLARARARLVARHYESAVIGRRTDGFHRLGTDANAAAAGATLSVLRAQARDLTRNNAWARRGLRRILADAIGTGIRPKATGRGAELVMARWKDWAETTECDAAGRCTFYGLQRLILRTIAESGEVLIRRRFRLATDGLTVPLQLQVLEPDYIDTGKDGIELPNGGEIVQGVEFDAIGRRVAYWLFDRHPGGMHQLVNPVSRRIPADGILHVFDQERAGQVRGPSWFASVDVRLHDLKDFEDATLTKQKIAACMAVFTTDMEGLGQPLGQDGKDAATGKPTDMFEPGMVVSLPPGKNVTVANPPAATDHESYSATELRGVAAGLGTTYSGMTGDYSQANYSSERAARLDHQGDVESWQVHMLVPQFCQPAWRWFMQAMILNGDRVEDAPADWTCAPMPILDPLKEAVADTTLIRSGLKSWACAVRERGYDPDKLLAEIVEYNAEFDADDVVLDSDPRRTNSSGQQQTPGSDSGGTDTGAGDASSAGAAAGDGGDAASRGRTGGVRQLARQLLEADARAEQARSAH